MKISLFIVVLFLISCNNRTQENTNKFLRVSSDGHSFQKADGTPFFWLADTGWELFNRLKKDEINYYLETRKSQGFNVIQAVILAELDGLEKKGASGELPLINKNPDTPNEKYFKYIDYVVDKAASLNMYLALLPTWGKYWYEDSIFNEENSFRYCSYLGNRYKDKWNIIWMLGGDRNPNTMKQFQIISSMANGLKNGDGGNHLITYHTSGTNTSLSFFQNEDWIDFHTSQSGHARRDMPNFLYTINNYMQQPAKPFIDAEPAYEDIPVEFWLTKLPDNYSENPYCIPENETPKGYFNDYDIRKSAYRTVFSGAAGYTYGNGSIWCFWDKGRFSSIPIKQTWKKSLNSPGGKQMKYLKKIINLYGINNLIPDRSIITDNWVDCNSYRCALKTKDNSSLLIYIPDNNHVRISMYKLNSGKKIYRWYNPRTGVFTQKKAITDSLMIQDFHTPEKDNDWVLVIDVN